MKKIELWTVEYKHTTLDAEMKTYDVRAKSIYEAISSAEKIFEKEAIKSEYTKKELSGFYIASAEFNMYAFV